MAPSEKRSQAGFSIVEMLVAAVILAVGILGVSLLQLMAMRASLGGRALASADQVAGRILDQVENEGRLTWLNVTTTETLTPPTLANLQYLNKAQPLTQYYDLNGNYLGTTQGSPTTFYTAVVTTTPVDSATGTMGGMVDCQVQVQWIERVTTGNAAVPRSLTLVRRILHG